MGCRPGPDPAGHVALLAGVLVPKVDPTLTVNAAMLCPLTQSVNSAHTDPTCIWPKSWLIPPDPQLGLTLTLTQTHMDPI